MSAATASTLNQSGSDKSLPHNCPDTPWHEHLRTSGLRIWGGCPESANSALMVSRPHSWPSQQRQGKRAEGCTTEEDPHLLMKCFPEGFLVWGVSVWTFIGGVITGQKMAGQMAPHHRMNSMLCDTRLRRSIGQKHAKTKFQAQIKGRKKRVGLTFCGQRWPFWNPFLTNTNPPKWVYWVICFAFFQEIKRINLPSKNGLHIKLSKILPCNLCNALHDHYIFLLPEHIFM